MLGLVVVLTAVLEVGSLLLIKPVFDNALFCPQDCPNLPLLFWLIGAMVAIPVVAGVLGLAQPYLANLVGQRVMRDLRDALYVHLQRMSLRFFTQTKTGEIQSRLANDVGGVQRVVTETASLLLMHLVTLVSALGAMLLLSWQLTVLSLALMPLFVWLTERVGRARRVVGSRTQETMAELSVLTEKTLSVSGALLSRTFGRRREEITRFRRLNTHLADLQVHQEMIGQRFFMAMRIFFAVMPALAYLLTGLLTSPSPHPSPTNATVATHLSAGTLVAFTTLQIQLFPPIYALLQATVQVQASLALFERIFDYLDLPHDILEAPHAIALPPQQVRGAISLRNVSFRYPTTDGTAEPSHCALTNLSLEIKSGQLAAIVGASGSGKTTLSYLLARLYDVTEGAVLIDGHDVRDIRLDSLTAMIGMVTQETHLFHASIRNNLRYGDPHATDDQLEAAARAAAIHHRILQLDNGYDTLVGERGYRLSGGEKQRLAIARLILKNPRILILDEATSALDTTNERLVHHALTPLMAGRTTIAIAHRLSTIQTADIIFVLNHGHLAEHGTHTELLHRGGIYTQLYHHQFATSPIPHGALNP